MLQLIICLFIRIISDAVIDYSDNMSKQVDVVEVKTEPNESDDLFTVTNMVDNHSGQDKIVSKSKNVL